MPETQEPFIGEDGKPVPLGSLVSATLDRSRAKLAATLLRTPAILAALDTPDWRAKREAERAEEERIEQLLSLEYGPAIEPQHPWWECDCP